MTQEAPDKFYDLKTLSEALSLSRKTIGQLIRDLECPLPAYRVGGKLLFESKSVAAWLEKHRVTTINVDAAVDEALGFLASADEGDGHAAIQSAKSEGRRERAPDWRGAE